MLRGHEQYPAPAASGKQVTIFFVSRQTRDRVETDSRQTRDGVKREPIVVVGVVVVVVLVVVVVE